MTLRSDITAALPGLRAHAESLMVSTCTITRGGTDVWNEETGAYDSTAETVYTGPCRVRFPSTVVRETDAQNQFAVEQEPVLSLPVVGSELVTVDDVVTITANPFDTAMVGLTLRIAGVHTQTQATARRFPVEVTSG